MNNEERDNTIRTMWILNKENNKLKNENELLREELTNLKNDITRVYNTMISLEVINKEEMEEVEEL